MSSQMAASTFKSGSQLGSRCLRMGSKFRCIRSTPTEMQSIRKNDFECLASTDVNTPETMSPNSGSREVLTSQKPTSEASRRTRLGPRTEAEVQEGASGMFASANSNGSSRRIPRLGSPVQRRAARCQPSWHFALCRVRLLPNKVHGQPGGSTRLSQSKGISGYRVLSSPQQSSLRKRGNREREF